MAPLRRARSCAADPKFKDLRITAKTSAFVRLCGAGAAPGRTDRWTGRPSARRYEALARPRATALARHRSASVPVANRPCFPRKVRRMHGIRGRARLYGRGNAVQLPVSLTTTSPKTRTAGFSAPSFRGRKRLRDSRSSAGRLPRSRLRKGVLSVESNYGRFSGSRRLPGSLLLHDFRRDERRSFLVFK